MTIESAERVYQANPAALPEVIGQASVLVRQVEETFPDVDVQSGNDFEAAIAAHHAFFDDPEPAREVLSKRFPDDPTRVERQFGKIAKIVDELLDEAFAVADGDLIDRAYKSIEGKATSGNHYAAHILEESAKDGESTGVYRVHTKEEAELEEAGILVEEGAVKADDNSLLAVDGYRFLVADKQELDKVREDPLEIDVDEAAVILAALVEGLQDALASSEKKKAIIIPLSDAVRLVFDHVDPEIVASSTTVA